MSKMNIIQKLFNIRKLQQQFYKWDRKKLEAHQKKQLKKIIKFSRNNSVYYATLFSSLDEITLEQIPIMTKSEMMDNFNQINTRNLQKEELVEYTIAQEKQGQYSRFQGEYSIGLSSGTSGNKALTVLSQNESDLYNCLLFSRNGIPKSVKNRRILFALRRNNPTFKEISNFGIHLVYIDYTLSIEKIIKLINTKKLNILSGPPSLLEIISSRKDQIEQPIKAVISYAEVLSKATREKLEEIFEVPIIEIYQGAEGFIASTCRCGSLHLNEDVLLIETLDVEDKIGNAKNLLITDLYRTTQPIIRYKMNDIVELQESKCQCGSCFRVIEKIHGRSDDIFHLKNKEGKISYLFPDYVRRSINQASPEIEEYQAIQKAMNKIEIRLVLKNERNREVIEKKIIENLNFWVEKLNAELGNVAFSKDKPERNPRSKKLIRVIRRF